jgi:uncharacterized protein
MPDAVSDSSPLIHLAKIEALELISRLYSRILIPPAVWREVVEESDGRPGAVEMERAVAAGWMVKQATKNETLVIALRQTLDNGEAEAIALATELHPESVLLDDKLARQMARRLGVPVIWYHGSAAAGETAWTDSRAPTAHDLPDHRLIKAEVGRGLAMVSGGSQSDGTTRRREATD